MSDTLDSRDVSPLGTTDTAESSASLSQSSPASDEAKVVNEKATGKPKIILPAKQSASKKKSPSTSSPPLESKPDLQNMTDWMDREYRGVSIYAVLMGVLLTLILWTGISTVRQIQAYHHQYTELQKIKKEYRKLQIEHQRLLIEQQTFSATPQIARRAVTELNMFYPKLSDRLIIQQPATAVLMNSPANDLATHTEVAQ